MTEGNAGYEGAEKDKVASGGLAQTEYKRRGRDARETRLHQTTEKAPLRRDWLCVSHRCLVGVGVTAVVALESSKPGEKRGTKYETSVIGGISG